LKKKDRDDPKFLNAFGRPFHAARYLGEEPHLFGRYRLYGLFRLRIS
jgi:hypothetical protein